MNRAPRKYNVLLLANTGHLTAAVQDHVQAITAGEHCQWFIENPLTCKLLHKMDLSYFDAIGLHYSIKPYSDYYFPAPLAKAVRAFAGVKFLFLQDEYEKVNRTVDAILSLKMDILFTLVAPSQIACAYPKLLEHKIKIVSVLTAYMPTPLLSWPKKPLAERSVDIFYRTREYAFWLGELAQQRLQIAKGVQAHANEYNLRVDVSVKEIDRIYGDEWNQRMQSARAVLGTESGASIWDVTGDIADKTRAYLAEHPAADFAEVSAAVLAPFENQVHYATISPRVFEAAALHTAMILFPGDYNGILQADVHYIPLAKDFSNFAEVVQKLRDDHYITTMTERAYQDLVQSGSYAAERLAEQVYQAVDSSIQQKHFLPTPESNIQTRLNYLRSKRYAISNLCLGFLAEMKFMWQSFWQLFTDPRYRGMRKITFLYHGVRRYTSYVIARWR